MQLLTLFKLFKFVRYLVVLLFFLIACLESKITYAFEASSESKHVSKPATLRKSMDSCTKRCHVNYMAYENDYK